MSLKPQDIVKGPIITEESQIQTAKGNQYTFKVSPKANKGQIRDAIEAIFASKNVKVLSVNTMNYEGKMRRQFGTRNAGRRASYKKAIVTLRPGDELDLI